MKTAAILIVAALTASCASPPRTDPLDTMPLPTVTWEAAGAVTLPLHEIGDNWHMASVVVELTINGEKASFMVDSGSSTTWFTKEFTRTIKARVSGQKIMVHSAGGTKERDLVILETLDVGFARLHQLWVTSGDVLEDVNQALVAKGQRPLAGLLGLDVLMPLGASLDLADSTITFCRAPDRRLEPTPGAVGR